MLFTKSLYINQNLSDYSPMKMQQKGMFGGQFWLNFAKFIKKLIFWPKKAKKSPKNIENQKLKKQVPFVFQKNLFVAKN